MRILGIDPSLRGTGYGIIDADRNRFTSVTYGVVKNPASRLPSRCLVAISQAIKGILIQFQPEVCAVEGVFYVQNLRTAIVLGHARGAALTQVAECGLQIYEYAPRKVKQSIVGFGAAAKNQVGFMVKAMLKLEECPLPDAADALAVALTHAQTFGRTGVIINPPNQI